MKQEGQRSKWAALIDMLTNRGGKDPSGQLVPDAANFLTFVALSREKELERGEQPYLQKGEVCALCLNTIKSKHNPEQISTVDLGHGHNFVSPFWESSSHQVQVKTQGQENFRNRICI